MFVRDFCSGDPFLLLAWVSLQPVALPRDCALEKSPKAPGERLGNREVWWAVQSEEAYVMEIPGGNTLVVFMAQN